MQKSYLEASSPILYFWLSMIICCGLIFEASNFKNNHKKEVKVEICKRSGTEDIVLISRSDSEEVFDIREDFDSWDFISCETKLMNEFEIRRKEKLALRQMYNDRKK